MKKNKLFVWGMAAVALTFMVGLAGCGGGGGGSGGGKTGEVNSLLKKAGIKAVTLDKPEQYKYDLTGDGAGIVIQAILIEEGTLPTALNIPGTIEGYPVTEIDFSYNVGSLLLDTNFGVDTDGNGKNNISTTSICSVTIPQTVTKINGLDGLENLTGITLPPGLIEIGDSCFSESGLTAITIPASVTTIGEDAFHRCNLTEVVIPEGVTMINASTFFMCEKLTTVTIPESVTEISGYAFSSCSELTTVNLPSHPIKYTDVWGHEITGDRDSMMYSPFGNCPKLSLAARKIIQDTGYKGEF